VKVSIRTVREADLGRLNDIVNDPDVAAHLIVTPPVSMKSTADLYAESRKTRSWFAVVCDGSVAGSVSLRRKPMKKHSHTADIGLAIAKKYWGMGVGAAAMDFAIGRARRLGLKRLELTVHADNRRAILLYGRKGFELEGKLRRAVKCGVKYQDVLVMARLL
jgi:L-phenylalanine/L-methionine N-acetyltransferase